MGLREQKKQQTRQLITEVAWQLFAENGFDQVTVTQIAKAATVAPATVFNYFPTKEDLFYGPMESFGARLVEAVRDRRPGDSALAAFERFLLEANRSLDHAEADEETLRRLTNLSRIIAGSPALQARERRALDECSAALAAELALGTATAEQTVAAQAAANAMLGLHRALVDEVRRRVLAGQITGLAADVAAATRASVALLAAGLGDYARATAATSG